VPEAVPRSFPRIDVEDHALPIRRLGAPDGIDFTVPIPAASHVEAKLRFVLLELGGFERPAPEEGRRPALHGLPEALFGEAARAVDLDSADLELRPFIDLERDGHRPRARRLRLDGHPGPGVPLLRVRVLDLPDVEVERPLVEELPGGGRELPLQGRLLDLLDPAEREALDPRPFRDLDQEIHPRADRIVDDVHIREETGGVEPADAGRDGRRIIAVARGEAERAGDDDGIDVDEAAGADGTDHGRLGSLDGGIRRLAGSRGGIRRLRARPRRPQEDDGRERQ
jgi:hypothetical protein